MSATKEEIAETFWRLTERYGYRRATVGDVADTLRISKKTIYEHFPDKEALYQYALEQWARTQRNRVESLLTEQSAQGRLEQIARIAFIHARQGFQASQDQDKSEPVEILDRVNSYVFKPLIRGLIEAGNASEEFAVSQPDLIASFCVAIGMAAVRRMRDKPEEQPEEDAIKAMLLLLSIDKNEANPGRKS